MAVDITATDFFEMGANFHPQSSSSEHTEEARNFLDANGNRECETMVGGATKYQATYKYCNASPDIATDLGTKLTTFGSQLAVDTDMTITGMTVTFTAGEYAEVEIEGVTYDDAAPTTSIGAADVSAAVPASAGFGVPAIPGVTLGTDASPISFTITFSLDHKMAEGSDGNHFTSNNITFEATGAVEYVGVPTTYYSAIIPTGWTTDSYTETDSNDDFDAASWNGHRYFDKI
jgi:hypothetical protein